MGNKTISFIQRNISGFLTISASIIFILLRLLFPDYVKENIADVLLMISLPMFILNYIIIYKIEETKDQQERIKSEIFETLGYKYTHFNSKESCEDYYKTMLTHSRTVSDLTWAEKNSNNHILDEDLFDNITSIQDFREIFIFKINGKYRTDRILRLKYIYDLIRKHPNRHIKYSCRYYDETSFERLQFTVFDEKEAIFTSSYSERCSIQEPSIISILLKYYEQSWKDANILITEGRIENESKILKLISYLPKQ